jgi:probable phosphoglycerate mutase
VIARRLQLDVIIEPDLDEIDFGAWTGWRFDVLHATREWQVFNQLRSAAQIPDGETMLQAQARAVTAIMRLRVRWGASELAVVSHGDVVKAVLAHFIGMPIDLMRRIEIAPASRSVLRLREMDVSVDGINLPAGT